MICKCSKKGIHKCPETFEKKPTLTEWLENRNKENIGKWYNSDFLLHKIKSGEFRGL
jgi:hypothetical protein